MKSVLWIFAFVTLHFSYNKVYCGSCKLPTHWRGHWHNNKITTIRDIHIEDTSIEGIGHCVAQSRSRDRYLMHNQEEDCYRCMLVIERHENVIQYRQSFCKKMNVPDLQSTCNQLTADTPLLTLVRVRGHPQVCPFSKMKSITYNNNTDKYCDNQRSQVQTCASERKMKFTFKACPDIMSTMDSEFEVECLATWKEGSQMYLYTTLSHQTSNSGTPIFRCFVYNEFGPEIHAVMSLDASCMGYFSLKMKEDIEAESSSCTFANWLQGPAWLQTSGKSIYQVKNGGKQLQANRFKDPPNTGRTTHKYTCISDVNSTQTSQILVVKSVHKCTSSYQCIQLQRHTDHVVQLTEGSRSQTLITSCTDVFKSQKNIHSTSILVKNTEPLSRCPMQGTYKTGNATEGHLTGKCFSSSVHIGCRKEDTLSIYTTTANEGTYTQDEYRCLQEWTSEGNQYIIGRNVRNNEFQCLLYEHTRSGSVITVNENCQSHRGNTCKLTHDRALCPGRSTSQTERGGTYNNDNQQQHNNVHPLQPTNSASTYIPIITSYSLVLLFLLKLISYR